MKNNRVIFKLSIATLSFYSMAFSDSFSHNTLYYLAQDEDSATAHTNDIAPPPQKQNTDEQKPNDTVSQKIQLGKSTATADREIDAYQSGAQVGRQMLESTPSGNGDIGSALKILPNVQFNNAQGRSSTPGEIDPASISISGGLFFQNNFLLDGFNMNNDINPMGNNIFGSSNHSQWGSTASQGLPVDTSLLDSITVLDSNVSAAYGRFTGGVVEANVRKPRQDKKGINGWHANMSYQITQGNANGFSLTRYHIDSNEYDDFINSTTEYYQPNFIKHLVRANVEGYATKNLGFIVSWNTTRSYIPLYAYSSTYTQGTEAGSKKDQKRVIDNYYIKAHYNPNENLTIEANLAYMPQANTYFRPSVKGSFFDLQSGGVQSGVKLLYQTGIGLLTSSLGYAFMESSRYAESNSWATWRYSEGDKNWVFNPARPLLNEGGFGDMKQNSHTLTFKSDFAFEPLELARTTHNFKIGGEAGFASVLRERVNGYYVFAGYRIGGLGTDYIKDLDGVSCPKDSLGLNACSEASTNYGGANYNEVWNGQYMTQVRAHAPGKNVFNTLSYGIFAEDDIEVDLGIFGNLNTRLGLRLDGDNYMSKHTLAPRFSTSYVTPAKKQWQTQLTFGANRYYGRNMLAYRIYDSANASQTLKYYYRTTPSDWILDTSANPITDTIFSKLKVPYDDELMGGIVQHLGIFSVSLKYIYRAGRDQIKRTRRDSTIPAPDSSHSSSSWVYDNDGRSTSHIIALTIQNQNPLKTMGLAHHFLFAYDWTQVKRGYNPYLSTTDEGSDMEKIVYYDGKFMRYSDRPLENFARPFTLRFTTTHGFIMGKTKWVLNNFFRYRAGYERMLVLRKYNNGTFDDGYNLLVPADITQYGKVFIKGAFNWDMRAGFERVIRGVHTLYVNVDIYNVLNLRNETTLSLGSANLDGGGDIAYSSSYTAKAYEVGRQFWVQVGYKF